ncbi:S-adenosyl-L-methionine-dependent methyltransferase [Syncephalis pseudoplumigaleata]|uniref:S-adenosyl-L-methionine-dependent methyltransferase n=1 Tax=Syncephalis pseudoplumigaleata TaxID=1712513 RepID=A0A4P9YYI7_9FUNG|nr:S-adenosyl-L-methionine-dependent methyltransferase [Syncephalis pseudoplumigaleata]|eukprot:RKP25176.1 S-adenosyl-L-methionine-dependent methyltransferase [Syncephalis pseudoplumigaleata]
MHDASSEQRVVSAEQAGVRLYRFVQRAFPKWLSSKRRSLSAIRAGEVRVNGQAAEETRLLREGDCVELCKDVAQQAAHELARLCTTVYTAPASSATNEHGWSFAVVWKPAGVACQELELTDTKVRGWIDGTADSTQAIYWLEKAACGWLILARNTATHRALQEQLASGEMQCRFRVLCKGMIAPGIVGEEVCIPASAVDGGGADPAAPGASPRHVAMPVRARIVDVSLSNSFGHLTTLDAWLDVAGNNRTHAAMATSTLSTEQTSQLKEVGALARFVRQALASIGHPVIGNLPDTVGLPGCRDKGYMLALTELSFRDPRHERHSSHDDGGLLRFQRDEPDKMGAVRERENRFRTRKLAVEARELERADTASIDVETSADGMPLAYTIGEKAFCSLRFRVTKDTLIPRPSTETLVAAALDWMPRWRRPGCLPRILDIGTGCGCLLISILHALPTSTGIGVDVSSAALAVAQDNAARLLDDVPARYRFVQADMQQLDEPHELAKLTTCTSATSGAAEEAAMTVPFTHVVCNPPYLTDKRYRRLSMLAAEPELALVGPDNDGLGAYRALATVLQSDRLLLPGGLLILEVGCGLADRVADGIFGLHDVWRIKEKRLDRQNAVRCLVFEKRAAPP